MEGISAFANLARHWAFSEAMHRSGSLSEANIGSGISAGGADINAEVQLSSSAMVAIAKFLAASPDIARLRAAIVPSLLKPSPAESVIPAGVLYIADSTDKVLMPPATPVVACACVKPNRRE